MKSQYPMTTHNHITSVLNIFKGRTGKWLMLFLLLLPALATAQETKKLIILQTSDIHSRCQPKNEESSRSCGRLDTTVDGKSKWSHPRRYEVVDGTMNQKAHRQRKNQCFYAVQNSFKQ